MKTTINIIMGWTEDAPGWIANASASVEYEDGKGQAVQARSAPSRGAADPLASISEVIDRITEELNIHPNNTDILVRFDGAQVLEAHRRFLR